MVRLRWKLVLTLLGLVGSSAFAQPPAALDAASLRARSLAATCAACHGTDGHAISDPAVPGLAGRPAAELAQQLKDFRSGARPGTVMPQLAKGYDDAQISAIARYFAEQKPHPRRGRADAASPKATARPEGATP